MKTHIDDLIAECNRQDCKISLYGAYSDIKPYMPLFENDRFANKGSSAFVFTYECFACGKIFERRDK